MGSKKKATGWASLSPSEYSQLVDTEFLILESQNIPEGDEGIEKIMMDSHKNGQMPFDTAMAVRVHLKEKAEAARRKPECDKESCEGCECQGQ